MNLQLIDVFTRTDPTSMRVRVYEVWANAPREMDATITEVRPGPYLMTDADQRRMPALASVTPPNALTTILQLLGAHNALVASHNALLARLRTAGFMDT